MTLLTLQYKILQNLQTTLKRFYTHLLAATSYKTFFALVLHNIYLDIMKSNKNNKVM